MNGGRPAVDKKVLPFMGKVKFLILCQEVGICSSCEIGRFKLRFAKDQLVCAVQAPQQLTAVHGKSGAGLGFPRDDIRSGEYKYKSVFECMHVYVQIHVQLFANKISVQKFMHV